MVTLLKPSVLLWATAAKDTVVVVFDPSVVMLMLDIDELVILN